MSLTVKRHLFLYVRCPIFLTDFNEIWNLLTVFFMKVPSMKFHVILSSQSRADTDGEKFL